MGHLSRLTSQMILVCGPGPARGPLIADPCSRVNASYFSLKSNYCVW